MIKRIIFDQDNTIMMWHDEYYDSLNKTFEYLNIEYNEEVINKLKEAVDNYEKEYNMFDRTNMKKIFEKYSKLKLPNNFIDTWIHFLKDCYQEDKELISTLEYLSSKYELVILTNWFTESQEGRLENLGILKYFKEVIGTDKVLNKPNKEAYLKASNPYNVDECIMIGDSINTDIIGALNIGMAAILLDYENKYHGNLKNIKKIEELKNIL